MELVMTEQRKKIHPHKFTLWIAIGSITMMFAGLTSAYIIKRNQPNWLEFDLPVVFWYSTAAIVASSVTIWLAVRAFRQSEMAKYRQRLVATFFLGIVFVGLQVTGFVQLWNQGLTMTKNVSISFSLKARTESQSVILLTIIAAVEYQKTTGKLNSSQLG